MTKREKQARQEADNDLRAVLSTAEGRRLLFRWIDRECRTFSASFQGQAALTDYNEGRRSIGIGLMTEAQRVAPELYVLALQEQLQRQGEEQVKRDAAQAKRESEESDG